jgi:hypothetical protein
MSLYLEVLIKLHFRWTLSSMKLPLAMPLVFWLLFESCIRS